MEAVVEVLFQFFNNKILKKSRLPSHLDINCQKRIKSLVSLKQYMNNNSKSSVLHRKRVREPKYICQVRISEGAPKISLNTWKWIRPLMEPPKLRKKITCLLISIRRLWMKLKVCSLEQKIKRLTEIWLR
jgi:hypothetical protein